MAQKVYENMVILDSNKYAQDPNGLAGRFPTWSASAAARCSSAGCGTSKSSAYPIDGHKKGTYWLTYFRLDSRSLAS